MRKVKSNTTPPTAPALPPMSEAEMEADRSFAERINEVTRQLRQQNLENAVLLAEQAAAGIGPLGDHFAELGRRYADLLTASEVPLRPIFRVIEGGLV